MAPLLKASELTLVDLEERFSLHRSIDSSFFTEARESFPPLSELETIALQRVKENFLDQLRSRLLIEETVKLIVIALLLDLAGFYRSPYQIESEFPIQLDIPDDSGDSIQGRIDTLVIKQSSTEFATSNLLSIVNDGNELDRVLQLLRRLG